MEQSSESPLSPLGQQLLSEHAAQHLDAHLEREWPQVTATPPSVLMVWLMVPFFIIDILFGPVTIFELKFHSGAGETFAAMAIGLWVGLATAQITILNLYAALSPEPIWQRLLVLVPQSAGYCAAGLAGMGLVCWYEEWTVGQTEVENSIRFYCVMPLLMMVGQAPFFCLRGIFGWKMIPVDREPTAPEVRSRLSIANLMIATAVVAVALGIVRLAPIETLDEPQTLWMLVAVFGAISAGFSLLGGISLLVLLHLVRSNFARFVWIAGLLLLAAIVSWVIYGLLTSWQQLWREGPLNTLIFGIIFVTFLGGFSGCLHWMRRIGWIIAPAHAAHDM